MFHRTETFRLLECPKKGYVFSLARRNLFFGVKNAVFHAMCLSAKKTPFA